MVRFDGTGLKNVTLADDEPNHLYPAWAPSSRLIASGTELGGPNTNHEVYSVTSSVDGATRHVATSTAIGPISWSHDRHFLAIDDHESAIVARADGSSQKNVAIGCCGVWSKRTARLAVAIEHANGGTDIYLVTPAGHVVRRLTKPLKHRPKGAPLASANTPLAWSQDASRLLFSSDRTGRPGLYVMHADGSRQVRVATARYGDISRKRHGRRLLGQRHLDRRRDGQARAPDLPRRDPAALVARRAVDRLRRQAPFRRYRDRRRPARRDPAPRGRWKLIGYLCARAKNGCWRREFAVTNHRCFTEKDRKTNRESN